MKYFISTLITFFCLFGLFSQTHAAIDINTINQTDNIKSQSIGTNQT
ncbi:MAG: hypothetical protein ACPHY8_00615 [Patescibacteria group bacterium]